MNILNKYIKQPLKVVLIGSALTVSVSLFAQPDGKALFEGNCTTCHAIGSKLIGPDLVGIGDRRSDEWITSFIKNSKAMIDAGDKDAVKVWEENNKVEMTAFAGSLSDEEIAAVVGYIKTAQPEAAPAPEPTATTPTGLPQTPVAASVAPETQIYIALIVAPLFVMLILLLAVVVHINRFLRIEKGAEGEEVDLVTSWISGKMTDEVIEGHTYDGINELNNSMPPWLMWIFYGTFIFAVVYLLNYHVFKTGDFQDEEYRKEMAEAVQKYGDMDVVRIAIQPVTDAAALGKSKEFFLANCKACHGENGEGNAIGPNLTDEYWLNGGKLEDVFHTIRNGVPNKGMISWKGKLSDEEILSMATFIKNMKGTNPANAKAPQGEKSND